ncbi:MAG: flippase-like domain-containing protein [Candidatus Omnitrophica bacterium]|nr:flippase-like domain-containing protein [Candidatus Omnitrophota bacterium]
MTHPKPPVFPPNCPVDKTQTKSPDANNTHHQNRLKQIVLSALRIVISLGMLAAVFFMFRGKLDDVGRILLETRLGFLLAAIVIYFAGFSLVTYRLKLVMAVQKIRMNLRNLFSIGLIGFFFNNFLPSSIGGDAVKAYYAYRLSGKKLESFSAVFVDRLMGLFTLIGLAVAALILFRSRLALPNITGAVFLLALACLAVLIFFGSRRAARGFKIFSFLIPSEKFREKIRSLYHSINGYRHHPGPVTASLLLSVMSQSLFIIVSYFLALSLNTFVPLWVFFILIPVIGTVSMVPSLNGLGVREGAYVYLFSYYCSSQEAFALSILNYFILILFSCVGGLVYFMRRLVFIKEMVSTDMIEELAELEKEEERRLS